MKVDKIYKEGKYLVIRYVGTKTQIRQIVRYIFKREEQKIKTTIINKMLERDSRKKIKEIVIMRYSSNPLFLEFVVKEVKK